MANKSPLQTVNEAHGGKEKLVDKVMDLIEKGEEEASELRQRLLTASNKKLLRLLRISETIRQKYGSADKLAAVVANALGRAKDNDYVKKLGEYSPARLLDMAQALEKRVGGALTGISAAAAGAAKGTVAKAKKPAATTAQKAETAEKKPAAAKKAPKEKAAPAKAKAPAKKK